MTRTLMILAALWAAAPAAAETTGNDPSPYRRGEAFGTPATCDSLDYWIDNAPLTNDRVTMTVEGPITASQWDGTLAYLVMCDHSGVQVMCVTYEEERASPNPVIFAGGFRRVGKEQIMLDPCLVYPVDGPDPILR